MLEELLKHLEKEKKVIDMLYGLQSTTNIDSKQAELHEKTTQALITQLRELNKQVPELLKTRSTPKETIPKNQTTTNIPEKILLTTTEPLIEDKKNKKYITMNKKDKKEFLQELRLGEESFGSIKKETKEEKKEEQFPQPSIYVKLSNKLFRKLSDASANALADVGEDLKRGNIKIMLSSYLSMMYFSILLSFFLGGIIYGTLIYLNPEHLTYFWIIILLPVITGTGFYLYPASEASSVQKSVSQELPFATIHMSAIAGSDISPLKIFKIIGNSKEYSNVGREIQKVVGQVEFYGNDLVTALKEVAKKTPNKNLSEIFSGLATNISTGGALKTYLQKKSENFLLDYKLERQQYTDLAGTFMDIYISVLIAAPLVLMMMFIVMNVSGLGFGGLGITALMFLSIGAIVIINIIFLVFVNLKQPSV